jgi:hypothetical protein
VPVLRHLRQSVIGIVLPYGEGEVSLNVTFWFALVEVEGHMRSLFTSAAVIICHTAETQVAHFADVKTTYLFDAGHVESFEH